MRRAGGAPKPDAKPNLNKIYTAQPTFVRSTKNAKLYHVGDGEDRMNVLHLWGNAYERGFAHGSILKNDTAEFYSRVYPFFEQSILRKAFLIYYLLTGLSHGCQKDRKLDRQSWPGRLLMLHTI